MQNGIICLSADELNCVAGAEDNLGEGLATIATGIAILAPLAGPAAPAAYAVAATTLVIAFAAEAFEK
jgi:hypothetical protein